MKTININNHERINNVYDYFKNYDGDPFKIKYINWEIDENGKLYPHFYLEMI